jgi:DNA-binding response OmpR family regulator
MDVRMPTLDGIEATRVITASGALSHVLILTTFDLDEYAFSALRAGASGFLLKDVPPDQLAQAIRTVARGDAVVSPRITKRLLEEYAHQLPDLSAGAAEQGAVPAVLSSLTGRETEVLIATSKSPNGSSFRRRQSNPMSGEFWPSSGCAIGCRRSCWLFRRGWCARHDAVTASVHFW